MAITNYFVDPAKPDDTGTGADFANAKKTINGALALITEPLTDDVVIKLKNAIHTIDAEIQGINCFNSNANLVIQGEIWSQPNYENANGDPFNAGNGVGDFDITQDDKQAILDLKLTVKNSKNVLIRGVKLHDSVENGTVGHTVEVMDATCFFEYCRFEGLSTGIFAFIKAFVAAENCYFQGNRVSIISSGFSKVALVGDNYIIDACARGIYTTINSTTWFFPWMEHPRDYHTTYIKTTKATAGRYAAVEASIGSTIFVQTIPPAEVLPLSMLSKVIIANEYQTLSHDYFGVILGSKSHLAGHANMTFTTMDLKGDTVEMPKAQQVIEADDEDTTITE